MCTNDYSYILPQIRSCNSVYVTIFTGKLTFYSINFRVFWDVTPYSHVAADQRLKGAYCLHHQGNE
jgi:hypothetical protein